jgi:Tfp pilus assembly protein FimT
MRRANTLLELLLVLALMVAVIAIILPSLGLFTQSQQLRDAAGVLRGEWARARVQAMKSGRIHVFRYEVGGPRYVVDFWIADDDAVEAGDNSALARTGDAPLQVGGSNDLKLSDKTLPEGITFFLGETKADSRGARVEADLAGDAGGQVSPPVLFYSDGTASTAQVILLNERGRAVTVSLRGLTGVARVSEVYTLTGGIRDEQ